MNIGRSNLFQAVVATITLCIILLGCQSVGTLTISPIPVKSSPIIPDSIPTIPPTKIPTPLATAVLEVTKAPTTESAINIVTTSTPQVPTASPTVINTTDATGAFIADHNSLPTFSSIPLSYLKAAAAIKTLFMHQSTGNNIDFLGLQCLAGLHGDPENFPKECVTYALNPYNPYDDRNWNWQEWAEPMADAPAKTDQWVSVVNAQQQNYAVLGMKFCYVDGWNQDFDYYRTKMQQLEQAYPQTTFIWSTSAIWAQSEVGGNLDSAGKIQTFNHQLRAYALSNNKILYDVADIESHDPNGNFCQSNGIEALCDAYYTGMGGGGGGHPNAVGSIRLAKGFWWLMARIGGWNGE